MVRCFHFRLLQDTVLFLFLTYWLFRSVPFNFHTCGDFAVFLLLLIFSSIPLWLGKMHDRISIFLNLLRTVLWPKIWSWVMFHLHLRKMCFLPLLDVTICKCLLGPSELMCHLSVMFPYWFSVWSIHFEVLKSPIIIVLLSISSFRYVNNYLVNLSVPMLGMQIFINVISSWWSDPFISI